MSGPPRPLELTRLAAEHLATKGIEDARLDAELLLAHVLGVNRLDLYLQFERPLERSEVDAYRSAIRRRADREPLQYITGVAAFRDLELVVDPRVLIPRPETEVLVGQVLDWAGERGLADAAFLDLGTGSGAIAVSLLAEGPFDRGVATDVSADALAVAAENGRRAGVEERLELRHGALFEPIGGGEAFQVIVANPPYIAEGERPTLMPEVRDHEPAEALFAGGDGLAVIRAIAAEAPAHLVPGGLLALEVGSGQAGAVAGVLHGAGFPSPWVVEDLTGRERIVLAVNEEGKR